MKALSVRQPFASLIGTEVKKFEPSKFYTDYRGLVLIAASCTKDSVCRKFWDKLRHQVSLEDVDFNDFAFGKTIAIATLTECLLIVDDSTTLSINTERSRGVDKRPKQGHININSVSQKERSLGSWQVGHYAWKFQNRVDIPQIPVTGKPNLWTPDGKLVDAIAHYLNGNTTPINH